MAYSLTDNVEEYSVDLTVHPSLSFVNNVRNYNDLQQSLDHGNQVLLKSTK
jgi:hypothetical protein